MVRKVCAWKLPEMAINVQGFCMKTIEEESHRHVSESSYCSSVGNCALGRMELVRILWA
jgi:hypothetical protein